MVKEVETVLQMLSVLLLLFHSTINGTSGTRKIIIFSYIFKSAFSDPVLGKGSGVFMHS